jgi:uncharacterized protein (DUF1800 family)
MLADFWHNHFNVRGWDGDIAPIFVHYDRDVIRKNLLGNFRTMLEDVAKSTAMLYFLDNRSNTGARPNENYARELFELHTMGAENYKGEFPQEQVPVSNGWPVAYVDADVYGATTCFTGWTTVDGLFQIDPNDHFPNQKVVFGRVIPANQTAEKDGRDVLDMLAQHPGTGRYVCRKLCRRFISDNPPERIVNEAAALFTAKWQAPDQLKQVVRLILLSPEFRSSWGQKIKRPFEVAVSALRSLNPDPPPAPIWAAIFSTTTIAWGRSFLVGLRPPAILMSKRIGPAWCPCCNGGVCAIGWSIGAIVRSTGLPMRSPKPRPINAALTNWSVTGKAVS